MRWLGAVLMGLGFGPLVLALGAETFAQTLPGCTLNEVGASGCLFAGRDISAALAHGYDGLRFVSIGVLIGFAGLAMTLAGWSRARAAARRARHR